MKKKKYIFTDGTEIFAFNAMEAFCIYNIERINQGKDIKIRDNVKSEKSERSFTIELIAKET